MITSKQRAFLRSLSHELPSMVQVGKEAITDETLKNLENYFVRKELVKINFLKTFDENPRDVAEGFAGALGAEVVSVIGRKVVLYRHNKDLAEKGEAILLPRA